MEANKKTVAALYDAALNKKDFEEAVEISRQPNYTQHNPTAADGPEGLKGFINFLKDKFPNNKSEIKRIFADGDYVIVHVHAVREPGTRGNAIIDIFRLENGKVVEHWDVVQPIPEKAAEQQRDVLASISRPGRAKRDPGPRFRARHQATGAPDRRVSFAPMVRDHCHRRWLSYPPVIDVAVIGTDLIRFRSGTRQWNDRSRKRYRRCGSATARPSTAKASSRSPRRCCSRA